MRLGHVGLNVTDLERSTHFYTRVFQLSVAQRGRTYAYLASGDDVVITLWEQATGSFSASSPGLHHHAFQVQSFDDVEQVELRLRAMNVQILHDGVVAHGAAEQSGGLFFADPDGIRLEVFCAEGAGDRGAPYGEEPTCGFF
ncbi:MAG: VOC family protein [Mycobacteriaceae bacterium]